MMQPFVGEIDVTWFVALFTAFLFASGLIIIRVLARDDPPGTILFWYHLFGALILQGRPPMSGWTLHRWNGCG